MEPNKIIWYGTISKFITSLQISYRNSHTLLFIFSEYSPIFLAISDTVKTTLPSQKYLHISLLWMAKFHAIPHLDRHLHPHLPLTHHSQPGSGYSSGSHRPILAEPLLLPGVMPDFASCLLSSSYALHPGVY